METDGAVGRQSEIFSNGEGRAWLFRNERKLPPETDPVLEMVERLQLQPKSVLEVGCANGWRLDKFRTTFGCETFGVDPSIKEPHHTHAGSFLRPGTADNLPSFGYDMIVYGFCLYLCDPEDYFQIVQQCDKNLSSPGYVVIYDFYTQFPYSKAYSHHPGVTTRKMDFSRLWVGHPNYTMLGRDMIDNGDDRKAVIILQKDSEAAFPVRT